MANGNSSPWPIDFDALEKGQVVGQEQIEKAYAVSYQKLPEQYRFKMMGLKEEIEIARNDLIARCDGLTVRILNDKEGDDYTASEIKRGVGRIQRNTAKRSRIDRDGFSEQDKRIAETRDKHATLLALAARRQQAESEREELLLRAPEGQTERLEAHK